MNILGICRFCGHFFFFEGGGGGGGGGHHKKWTVFRGHFLAFYCLFLRSR